MTEYLEPCPVCGREDTLRTCWDGRALRWRITCTGCGFGGPGEETGREARTAWNREALRRKEDG